MVRVLQDGWHLAPETSSKFERALAFVEGPKQHGDLLNPRERVLLDRIAGWKDLYGARARALLAFDQGHTQVEAGESAGRSERRVRHWLAAFRKHRMAVFPAKVLEPVTPTSPSELVKHVAETGPPVAPEAPAVEVERARPTPKPARPQAQ